MIYKYKKNKLINKNNSKKKVYNLFVLNKMKYNKNNHLKFKNKLIISNNK